MKRIHSIILGRTPLSVTPPLAVACLLVVLSMVAGCSEEPAVVQTETETIRLAVEGMHCTGCANMIEATVAKVPGVQTCSVSFEAGAATVVVAEGTDTDSLVRAVDELDAGYLVRLKDATD